MSPTERNQSKQMPKKNSGKDLTIISLTSIQLKCPNFPITKKMEFLRPKSRFSGERGRGRGEHVTAQ